MNLTRALDIALPAPPSLRFRETYFRFNPQTIVREQQEKKEIKIFALAPKSRNVFTFTPEQWKLVKLFDGRRSYEQVAALWRRQCGIAASPEVVRTFAESLDARGFWHKTPEEESISLWNELMQKRNSEVKRKREWSATRMYLFTFDADRMVTRVHRWLFWIYSPRFVIPSILAMLLMVGLWIARSQEVFRDSAAYWNMTEKSFRDILEFYFLFGIVGFFHEWGHALTVKHFGGEVHTTGMMLVYTIPAFFVDSSEVWVHAPMSRRVYTILAGFWVELMMCAVATLVWWGTARGSTAHDLAYKFILVGGIMPVLFNMNPLTRLDGYLAFCELVRIQNLREKANLFWSRWVQKNLFGLPVAVPVLPRRRAIFFATFSFLSGCYIYTVLLFLSRVTYNVVYHFMPDWAFLPAAYVAYRIFKSRIVSFLGFLRTLYLNKKEVMVVHRKTLAAAGAAALVFVFLPLWREEVQAPVILEAARRAVLRAEVPGQVESVFVTEGMAVPAGAPLLRMRHRQLDSEAARARSQWQIAAAASTDAQLRYADNYATRVTERQQWEARARLAADKQQRLTVTAPIAGIVVTPRVQDLTGAWLEEGATIAEVEDINRLRARIYVSEADLRTARDANNVSVKLDSRVGALRGHLESVSPTPQDLQPGLAEIVKYKGMAPPPHYVIAILLANDGTLRAGMSGKAKVFGRRRSLVGLAGQPIADFVGRKLW